MTIPTLPLQYFVFDVEAVGLHGEGFAVGFVVVTRAGHEQDSGLFVTSPDNSPGTTADREWINKNVVPALEQHVPKKRGDVRLASVHDVRRAFMNAWQYWKERGAVMAADCPWPVEARFLCACMDEDRSRMEHGPYPMIDVGSVRLAVGLDPLGTDIRLEDEDPPHNPLADARQSARLLLDALNLGVKLK